MNIDLINFMFSIPVSGNFSTELQHVKGEKNI